ncbi:hypothetical protein L596_021756 [Steinernema carpocapsae]|uniref:Uncharacterized protein n=1 Tax=Steinernema carpocapsae TaxID=34508 RepID=A0A4U5MJQ8_STECR|nr:hypothetical protein L596_021756 [Steinernema carpocapsae]
MNPKQSSNPPLKSRSLSPNDSSTRDLLPNGNPWLWIGCGLLRALPRAPEASASPEPRVSVQQDAITEVCITCSALRASVGLWMRPRVWALPTPQPLCPLRNIPQRQRILRNVSTTGRIHVKRFLKQNNRWETFQRPFQVRVHPVISSQGGQGIKIAPKHSRISASTDSSQNEKDFGAKQAK